MIYLLYGTNTFEIDRGLHALLESLASKYPDAQPEHIDGAGLTPSDLPDILQGANLFSDQRIIILGSPSSNKTLWAALEEYVGAMSDTTDLIIVDSAVDKRTRTFKALQKVANVREYTEFGPRNVAALQKWIHDEADRQDLTLSKESITLLIDRVGYDQWSLQNAITKLALVEDGSPERIRDLVDASPSANAFELFEAALRGEADRVNKIISDLELTSDPHALLGLLGTQSYQLALVAFSSKTPVELGKLIGSSPYPLQKLTPIVRKLTKAQIQFAVQAIAQSDRDVKHSVAPPWTLIRRALLKIASRGMLEHNPARVG